MKNREHGKRVLILTFQRRPLGRTKSLTAGKRERLFEHEELSDGPPRLGPVFVQLSVCATFTGQCLCKRQNMPETHLCLRGTWQGKKKKKGVGSASSHWKSQWSNNGNRVAWAGKKTVAHLFLLGDYWTCGAAEHQPASYRVREKDWLKNQGPPLPFED